MGNKASKTIRKLPTEVKNLNKNSSLPSKEAFSRDRIDPKFKGKYSEPSEKEQTELFERLKKFNRPTENEKSIDYLKTKGQGNMLKILKNRKIQEEGDKNAEETAIFNLKRPNATIRPIEFNDLIRKAHLNYREGIEAELAQEYKLSEETIKALLKHIKPCEIVHIKE